MVDFERAAFVDSTVAAGPISGTPWSWQSARYVEETTPTLKKN